MKNLLLILLLPFFAQSQILDVVEKGYYQVTLNDSIVSSHTKPNKAALKSVELKAQFPDADIKILQPNIEPGVDTEELTYLVNYNYNYAKKGITLYVPDNMEISEPILSDFDDFDVIITDKYQNVIAECKQVDIINIPNIGNYNYFFVRYKSEAFNKVVYKLKVVNGILKGV